MHKSCGKYKATVESSILHPCKTLVERIDEQDLAVNKAMI